MYVCESASRSVRVRGSCAVWLPLVRECLSSRGFRNIAVDAASGSLTADSGVDGAQGSISVRLSQASSCGETDVLVVATASLGADHFVGSNKMIDAASCGGGE